MASNGVDYYLKAEIVTNIAFPEGKVKCQYCKYCRAESDLKRFWCRIEDRLIYNPFAEGLPEFCPANITGEIIGTIPTNKRKEK